MDNYKISFIHGDKFTERNITDGNIEYFGEIDKNSLHVVELLNYGKEKFPDVSIFNQLTERHQPEVVAYFFTRLGSIVFLNTTRYNEEHLKRYGRSGMFMMPESLTEKQIESLKEFTKTISNYSVSISHNLDIETGILNGKTIQGFNGETPSELIDAYLKSSINQEINQSNK